jgi:hypothetical protein
MSRLLIRAVTGLIAGLLFAPQSGKRTQEMFKERFSSFRDTSMGRESMKGVDYRFIGPKPTPDAPVGTREANVS